MLLLSLAITLVFNVSANLVGLYGYSYDAYTHVFFADHYMRDWFSLWETRWYGGFPVTSYPPLVHQLIALLGFLVGAEVSYQVVCVASALLLVFSLYKASSVFVGREEAKYVSVVASLLPSLYLTLYVYGQLPTVFAASLSFLAAHAFHTFLLSGRWLELARASALGALVAASHHFTFFVFFPLLVAIVFLTAMVKKEVGFKPALRRLCLVSVIVAALVFVVLEPFFEFVANAPFQVEIPHASRGNIFDDISHSFLFFWGVYGFTVALIPMVFLIAVRRRELVPLFMLFMFMFILGLGGVTPIPRLVLGASWHILTFDRFAVWAGFLSSAFLGIMLMDAGHILDKYYYGHANCVKMNGSKVKAMLFVGLLASSVFTLSLDGFITPQPRVSDSTLEEIAAFLQENGDYRYVTFGLGLSMMRLSVMCSAETVDGGYNLARRLPIFISSGVERVDNAKFFPNSTAFLDSLMNQSADLGVRWVILADQCYGSILEKYGYGRRMMLNSDSTVEVWEKDNVIMREMQPRDSFNGFQVTVWSFGPLALLLTGLILCLKRRL